MRREVFDVGVKTLVQLNGDRYAWGIGGTKGTEDGKGDHTVLRPYHRH